VYDVPSLLDAVGPEDRVVATLPMDMLEVLVTLAGEKDLLPILRPVMRHRRTQGEIDGWRFVGFEEVLEARVRARRVGTWTS